MALKQSTRLLSLKTPLGENALVLTSFFGEESLSRPFQFTLSMTSDDNAIAAKDLLGKGVAFSIELADGSPRHFHGLVNRFYAGDEEEDGRRGYRAQVVPWLWLLTRNSDCRVFQKMTAPQIIEQIFKDRGFTDYQLKLSGAHAKREYCVQHQETDFNFVSRLMEEEGIFYFFEHSDGKHKMILGDKAAAYANCAQKEADYPWNFGTTAVEDHIRSWEHRWEFRTGKLAQTDYNFETPSADLKTTATTIVKVPGNDKFELFEYPGLYLNKGDGKPLTDVRMEEEEAAHDVVVATSICRAFTPGGKFKVRQHRASSEKGKSFVITSIQHSAHEVMSYEVGEAPAGSGYENSFTCIPDSVTYRPPRITPKPRVQGVQTAVVVGPPGEEIYPDKYGRVKVQFHWDRYGKKDENSSCWVRVSQVHAGKGFGGIDLPRIGDEVIVSFPDGDPDQPLITGRVYHAENMPPFALPGAKTISGMKTKTHKGGGYNELVMDDTAGKEEVRIHGQYDMNTTVEHDQTTTVINNRTDKINVDDSETVGSNQTIKIGAKQDLQVGGTRTIKVTGKDSLSTAAAREVTIGANHKVGITGAEDITINGNQTLTVGGAQTFNITGPVKIASGATITLEAGGSTIELGAGGIKILTGATVDIQGAIIKENA